MLTIISLFVLALVLFFLEIFIPGGILAIIGVILLIAACAIAYTDYGGATAMVIFCISGTLALIMFFVEIWLIQHKRFGKFIRLDNTISGSSLEPQAKAEEIVGKKGEALTKMAPTGMILIDGKKYEAFSQSGLLEEATPVEVVRVDNFRLIVKKI